MYRTSYRAQNFKTPQDFPETIADTSFSCANATGQSFAGKQLENVSFIGTKLEMADFTGATVQGPVLFIGADLGQHELEATGMESLLANPLVIASPMRFKEVLKRREFEDSQIATFEKELGYAYHKLQEQAAAQPRSEIPSLDDLTLRGRIRSIAQAYDAIQEYKNPQQSTVHGK